MTASSFREGFEPFNGRLNGNTSWMPAQNNQTEWIQIEFPQRMLITGVITQGGGDHSPFWVEQFTLSYTDYDREGRLIKWWDIKDDTEQNKVKGNKRQTVL